MSLRIIFMGTPEFSVYSLQALVEAGHEIVAVYSQSSRFGGRRGKKTIPSPVEQCAEKLGLPVYKPQSLKNQTEIERLKTFKPDAIIVVAYGLLLPVSVLEIPILGCYNVHASLLPRWRGAAPIQRAILAGDKETGVTIMQMDKGLDTGPMAMQKKISIELQDVFSSLQDKLAKLGAHLLVKAMTALEKAELKLVPQPEESVTYAEKVLKEETRLIWQEPAEILFQKVAAFSTSPGAWCEMCFAGKWERVKILQVKKHARIEASKPAGYFTTNLKLLVYCGEGCLEILRLQRAGGKPMTAAQFLCGSHIEMIN